MPPSITFADGEARATAGHRVPTTRRRPSFTLCTYLAVYLSLPLPPSLPRVKQGSIFKSTKSTTLGGGDTNKKEEGARSVVREEENDDVKLLRGTQTRSRSRREKLPQIAKDKRGAIRSFCLVTFIVSPALMAKKLPPTSPLLSNLPPSPPPHPTPRRTLCQ